MMAVINFILGLLLALFLVLVIGLVLYCLVVFAAIAGKEIKKIKEEEVQKDGGTE